jgi:hypothetical protein
LEWFIILSRPQVLFDLAQIGNNKRKPIFSVETLDPRQLTGGQEFDGSYFAFRSAGDNESVRPGLPEKPGAKFPG